MRKPSPKDEVLANVAKDIAANGAHLDRTTARVLGRLLDLIYSGNAGRAWKFAEQCWPRREMARRVVKRFQKQLRQSPIGMNLEN